MWYVCDVFYAVLYVHVSCFAVRGIAVSSRYIDACNSDVFSVNVYIDHLKICVVCINGRMYVVVMNVVVSDECDEPTPCLARPVGAHGGEVMYVLSVCFRGELAFLNCDILHVCRE